jgi:hypothetical protein
MIGYHILREKSSIWVLKLKIILVLKIKIIMEFDQSMLSLC